MISPCWGRFSKMDPRADPRSVTMRGGLVDPPACRMTGIRASHAFWWSEAPLRGRRVSRRVFFSFSFGGPSWLQVGSKIAPRSFFFSNFFARCFEVAFFSVFRLFFNGFWEVLGRIRECFGKVFPCFFQKIDSLKNSVPPRENQ